ncbi:MAG: 16S rRNA (cytosine(1402)-N(4))-methyltransferase, partial [Acidimicrobiales bacterium]
MRYRPRATRSLAIETAIRETSSAISFAVSIERLRMVQERFHEPVLASEVVGLFANVSSGVIIDATLGGGGHTRRLLQMPQFRV